MGGVHVDKEGRWFYNRVHLPCECQYSVDPVAAVQRHGILPGDQASGVLVLMVLGW